MVATEEELNETETKVPMRLHSLVISIDQPEGAARMRRQLASMPDDKFVKLGWDNVTIRGKGRELKRIVQIRG